MSAIVPIVGPIRQIDSPAQAEEQITAEQVGDAERLARLLQRDRGDIDELQRRFAANHVDHEDRVVDATGTKLHRFPHFFGGRVRYWAVEWSGAAAPNLSKHSSTTNDTLVLTSTVAGTVTLRIEESGG